MALLSTQLIVNTGLTPAFVAAAGGGDSMACGERSFLYVKNAGGGSINVTVNSQKNCDQGFDHDLVVAVPNGQERVIGPITAPRFADSSGNALITYSGVTSVTVAAIRI